MGVEDRPAIFNHWQSLWQQWHVWLNEQKQTPLQACLNFVKAETEIDRFVIGVDSLDQLKDTIPIIKISYNEYLTSKSKIFYLKVNAKKLYPQTDSIKNYKIDTVILNNYDLTGKISLLEKAIRDAKTIRKNINTDNKSIQWRRKKLNLYDIEFHNRIAFSLSCLILFSIENQFIFL